MRGYLLVLAVVMLATVGFSSNAAANPCAHYGNVCGESDQR